MKTTILKNLIYHLSKKQVLIGIFFIMFQSCSTDIETITNHDLENLPIQIVENARIVHSSNGNIDVELTAKEIHFFNQSNKNKNIFPKGVFLNFYDNHVLNATLQANYAEMDNTKKILEARNNVIICDLRSGDTIYLENIFWEQFKKRIYSNNFVKCINSQTVTYGDGFESDESMQMPKIINQRGTINVQEIED